MSKLKAARERAQQRAVYLAWGMGAALVVEDASLAAEIAPTVLALLNDHPRLAKMAGAARQLARPKAAAAIADELERLVQGRSGRRD